MNIPIPSEYPILSQFGENSPWEIWIMEGAVQSHGGYSNSCMLHRGFPPSDNLNESGLMPYLRQPPVDRTLPNNVLLVEIEGPVWYTIITYLVAKRVNTPLYSSTNQLRMAIKIVHQFFKCWCSIFFLLYQAGYLRKPPGTGRRLPVDMRLGVAYIAGRDDDTRLLSRGASTGCWGNTGDTLAAWGNTGEIHGENPDKSCGCRSCS